MSKTTQNPGPQVAGFRIKKVIYDHVAIHANRDGKSFGQLLDEYLVVAAEEHQCIEEVALQMDPEQWFPLAESIRQSNFSAETRSYAD